MSQRRGDSSFLNMLAFIAFVFVGLALAIALAFGPGDVSRALRTIAEILAYITIAFYSFRWAFSNRSRHRIIYIIVWTIAAVLITLTLILNILDVR